MKQYKVVPYAGTVVINKKGDPQQAIISYFDVINQESYDGWQFFNAIPVSVTRKKRGIKKTLEQYNAFIFVKED